ncbi:MAG: ClcB-like voltage-gated chloride channel protein [Pseudomonadota bacterium]
MLTLLLKTKLLLDRLPRLSATHAALLWAAVVGVIGALATLAFKEGLKDLELLLTGHSGSLVEMAQTLPWEARIILPAAGGIVAGSLLAVSTRYTSSAHSDYMEAIAIGDGKIPVVSSLLRSLSSLCTIASGGSIGREGSMVQLAAMCASITGRITRLEPARLRMLVACGAAAGIASAYNAPIASAFFVAEIVLGAIVIESFGPILVAAVVANIVMREMPGYHPTYEMPSFPEIPDQEIVLFVLLGVLAGLLAPLFLELLNACKRLFQKLALPLPLRLGIGGLAVGAISIWVPQVWGNGYSVVNSLLHQQWVWTSLLLVLASKILATALTTGSGAVGGIFTPTLFVGAAVGCLFSQGLHALWPQLVSLPSAFAVVGMGAFLAAATGAPLMAILMIFEMTLSYQAMLPLALACVAAYFIARLIAGASMYEITIRRNREEKARLQLRGTQMRDLIQQTATVLPLTATVPELSKMFLQHPVKYIYIVDEKNLYQGVVALQDLAAVLDSKAKSDTRHAADFVRHDFLRVITPDMSLSDAFQHFLAHQGERLPAIGSSEDPVFLGAVSKTSLLDAFYQLSQLDTAL